MKKFKALTSIKKVFAMMLAMTILASACIMPVAAEGNEMVERYIPIAELSNGQTDTLVNGLQYQSYTAERVSQFASGEDEYGNVFKVSNALKTTGEQQAGLIPFGQNLDGKYSVSFDIKLKDMPTSDKPIQIWMTDESGKLSGALRIDGGYLQLSLDGYPMGSFASEIDKGNIPTETKAGALWATAMELNKWYNIEYVVDSSVNNSRWWYINGKEVHTTMVWNSKATASGKTKDLKFLTYGTAGAVKEWLWLDNFRVGKYVSTAKVDKTALLEEQIHDAGAEKGVPSDMFLSTPTKTALQSADVSRYAISFDMKVTASTGFLIDVMGNSLGGGYPNLCSIAVEATTEGATMGRIGVHKNTAWPAYKDTLTSVAYGIGEYSLGEWVRITIVCDKQAKAFDVYADGRYIGRTNASTYEKSGAVNEVTDFSPLQISVIDSAQTSNAIYNNVRVYDASNGVDIFPASGTIDENGAITISLSEPVNNYTAFNAQLTNIKLYDKNGAEKTFTATTDGENVIITPAEALDYYKIVLPAHTFGVSGANLYTVDTVVGTIYEVTAEIMANGAVIGETELGNVANGTAVTLETSHYNMNTGDTQNAMIILAAYGTDGQLVAVDTADVSVMENRRYTASGDDVPSIIKTAEVKTIKGFVWYKDFSPVTNVISVRVAE